MAYAKICVYLCASMLKISVLADAKTRIVAKTNGTNPFCKTEFTNSNAFNFLSLSV